MWNSHCRIGSQSVGGLLLGRVPPLRSPSRGWTEQRTQDATPSRAGSISDRFRRERDSRSAGTRHSLRGVWDLLPRFDPQPSIACLVKSEPGSNGHRLADTAKELYFDSLRATTLGGQRAPGRTTKNAQGAIAVGPKMNVKHERDWQKRDPRAGGLFVRFRVAWDVLVQPGFQCTVQYGRNLECPKDKHAIILSYKPRQSWLTDNDCVYFSRMTNFENVKYKPGI